MSSLRISPGHAINTPSSKAIRSFGNERKSQEKYNSPRGTNPISLWNEKKFRPIGLEAFSVKNSTSIISAIIVVIIIVIIIMLLVCVWNYFTKRTTTYYESFGVYGSNGFDDSLYPKDNPIVTDVGKNEVVEGGDPMNDDNEDSGIGDYLNGGNPNRKYIV